MDENRDKWWQVRLSNVFASMTIIGAILAICKWGLNNGLPALLLVYMALPVLMGSAIGALFGRALIGACLGCLLSPLFMLDIGVFFRQ